ncbi:P-loop NTPase [Ornatilinea apprima]|uniref:P-loop NTPase n=1 Tax=Ornatilinea apprima TaxID=1134406 RepID=UPI00094677EF|nr:P-loop NTPase [Ornatilinea apprima]
MTNQHPLIEALSSVQDPELGKSIVELGMVKNLSRSADGEVRFTLALTTPACPLHSHMADAARAALLAVDGVRAVDIEFGLLSPEEIKSITRRADVRLPQLKQFNQVGQVILVMSGKGGVGKSSIAALLAASLSRQGAKTGLLDADITGPSIPKLFGLPPGGLRGGELGMLPAVTPGGVRVVSTNLLLKEADLPTVWRGPLIAATIRQFWGDTIWGKLDTLIVDLPPGTSDAAIAVLNYLPVSGAVVVTTPQELAGLVVRKALKLLQNKEVPLLALVENMSYFTDSQGAKIEVFGPSHLDDLADLTGSAPRIQIPILPALSQAADAGAVETIHLPEIDRIAALLRSTPSPNP